MNLFSRTHYMDWVKLLEDVTELSQISGWLSGEGQVVFQVVE